MKIFLTIAAIMSLVLMSVVFAGHQTSEEASAAASVTVNTFIDITLADTGTAGFSFGSGDPGITNRPENDQVDGASVTPAASITRQATSNVDVLIRLKGADFTVDAKTLLITNVDYDDDGIVDEGAGDVGTYTQETMQTTYPNGGGLDDPWATLTVASPSVKIWFWLDVPAGQAAGSYTSTFSFDGNSA